MAIAIAITVSAAIIFVNRSTGKDAAQAVVTSVLFESTATIEQTMRGLRHEAEILYDVLSFAHGTATNPEYRAILGNLNYIDTITIGAMSEPAVRYQRPSHNCTDDCGWSRNTIGPTFSLPWFENALQTNQPIWRLATDDQGLYSLQYIGKLLDSDGYAKNLMAVTIMPHTIQQLVSNLSIRTGANITLIANGKMIATAGVDKESIQNMVDTLASKIAALGGLDRIKLATQWQSESSAGVFSHVVHPMQGTRWHIGMSLPSRDLLQYFNRAAKETLIISILIVLIAFLLALHASRALSTNIRKLTSEVQKIREFDLDVDLQTNSAISEVQQLSNSLQGMQAGLQSFQKYVPADLVRGILQRGEAAKLGGETRTVTVLFTDLKGYSTIVENLPPDDVITIVNEYFSQMQEIIHAHGGVVLELLGDAILAVFGAPTDQEDHADSAVQAALTMRDKLLVLNRNWERSGSARYWQDQGVESLEQRAGIHTGSVVAGNIGGNRYMKYGMVGDSVNVAARLEQLNKQTQTTILISQTTYSLIPASRQKQTTDQGQVSLKGRQSDEHVYSL